MTIIFSPNQIDIRYKQVLAEAKKRGEVTLKAFESDGEIFLLEGSHRIEAAKELKLPVKLILHDEDDEIEHDFDEIGYATVQEVFEMIYTIIKGNMYTEKDFGELIIEK